jgi:hypothetical protein
LSEVLKILDPLVLETGLSGFAGLCPTEQIVVLHIGQKPDCPVWQTGTSGFSRKLNFPRFNQKPDACYTKSFIIVFSSLETCCTVKSSKNNNFQAFVKICIQRPIKTLESAGNLLHD